MRNPLLALEEETKSLANHHRRYLHAVRTHVGDLIARLEEQGLADRVHLWQPSSDPASEMDVVERVASAADEKLAFLGCYYCLQFLRMNLASIDALRLSLISPHDVFAAQRDFMMQAGTSFRALSGAYMEKLLDLFLQGKRVPRFAVIGVGTRADQDDIDVGLIDDGGTGRDDLNEAVARMSAQMLRYATSLHFHISEHVGEKGYSATVAEYRRMLDKAVHDFVIISEMLSGALIFGDVELYQEFEREVVSRYYFRPDEDPKWHLGYLRGMLGEIRSLVGRPLARDRIHPKDDGLRMIKGVLSVLKTIHGVTDVNAWRIIDSLRRKNPEDAPIYDSLENALSFLEVFRHVFQLVVAQEEQIYLSDEVMERNIDRVAEIMGYRTVGTITPGTHLLVDYYEHLETVRRDVVELTAECTRHLKETTVFADMFEPDYPGNVALDFAERSAFFKGTTFWRDILEVLEQDDYLLLRRYLADLEALSPGARAKVLACLEECAEYATGTVMAFVVLLARATECDGCQAVFDEVSAILRRKLSSMPYAAPKAIEIFYRRPRLINRYLSSIGDEATRELAELLKAEILDPEVALWRDKLARLVDVHSRASRYFRRYIDRAGESYPSCLTLLDNQGALRDMSRGVLAGVDLEPTHEGKKRKLGDFYDLEFLRIGLETLDGVPSSKTDPEFTDAADTYLQDLFDVCKREIDESVRFRVATHDLLAIYATGGLGREQAYDDDFDLIILLNTSHEDVRSYASRIVAKMNAEIIKRGTLPHYRFAEHFGHYVTTMDELSELLAEDSADDFVDKSQVLEARMIVGTRRFATEFNSRIVWPHVFDKRREYVARMREEILSRHADLSERGPAADNVKDGIGGMRDIVMLLLMYKAVLRLEHPVNAALLTTLARLDTRHRKELLFLSGALEFYKNLRNAYRVSVGAEDRLRPEHLHIVAAALGLSWDDVERSAERLMRAYRGCTTQVAEIVTSVASGLEEMARAA